MLDLIDGSQGFDCRDDSGAEAREWMSHWALPGA
jgi:hypothetical protein